MFREPLRRDPLVVGWVLLMLLGAFAALSNNTEWSGHLQADRVAGFLRDLAEIFLWSFFVLLLLAWLRARAWRMTGGPFRPARSAGRAETRGNASPELPWTDRWIRDWREAAAQQRNATGTESDAEPQLVSCRHGVAVDVETPEERAPVLRALSGSHTIVRPGSSVSVTWCFEHARDVVVDGRGGYPACGEALVRIDDSRRIELVGRNRHGATPVATAAIVAMAVPQLDLPTVASPPPVALRTDVAATVGATTSISQQLDAFWATQEDLRPRLSAPPGLVGVPTTVIEGLRRTRRTRDGEAQ
ncbi:hypothetical protein [Geodermatophilus sabuli]|uniref:Uncharacterized protein n=1 Tax=Geodermatophilus sabuli TaxID=1564158 RepID=A0A285EFA1_9ACTN|nr:hypothetical protein [Geodermatophilus sabuli]MBB3086668.1 hypothetical protein [Geodermatophilus sabuli]SNX97680.1 hypothetical protein SAMN06893097_10845 [Geodermatophilus sabuli]